jgi:hypothetical protein
MEGISGVLAEVPWVATAFCFAVLLLLYFLLKSLLRVALVLIMVAAVIGGYLYFRYPESRPAHFKDAMQKARSAAVKAVDQGKEIYERGRELLNEESGTPRKEKERAGKGKPDRVKGDRSDRLPHK